MKKVMKKSAKIERAEIMLRMAKLLGLPLCIAAKDWSDTQKKLWRTFLKDLHRLQELNK